MRRVLALVGSAGLVLGLGVVTQWTAVVPPAGVAFAGTTTTPHEHLPHTSSALKDIGSFDKTFDAPAPQPGASTPSVNAQRVRLANALPPTNQLSIPIVVLAGVLVLLGFLLHPFRKARRKKHLHQSHDHESDDHQSDDHQSDDDQSEGEGPHEIDGILDAFQNATLSNSNATPSDGSEPLVLQTESH
jgi:hypothetical protein